ncbi:MAG: hypothetical protein U0637_11320 [Phycisphaerales bacterium]
MKIWKGMVVVGAAASLMLVGCEEKSNPVTKATDAAKNAGNKVAEGAKDATKSVTDAGAKAVETAKDTGAKAMDTAKDAGAKAVDAGKDAAAAAGDKLKALQAEGGKWLTDTVDKQWPAMKTELEGYVKKVADVKDAGIKAKAEGLVKDLQAQVPAVEKAVGDLKNFKTGDFTSMFDGAKKAWDGFASKFGELKKLVP